MLRFRDYIDKLNIVNDGTRSLMESIAIPEVERALKDWNKIDHSGILIGGCAIGYYSKPRATTDVDILFLSKTDIQKQYLDSNELEMEHFSITELMLKLKWFLNQISIFHRN